MRAIRLFTDLHQHLQDLCVVRASVEANEEIKYSRRRTNENEVMRDQIACKGALSRYLKLQGWNHQVKMPVGLLGSWFRVVAKA